MAIDYLKRGRSQADRAEDDARVRETVEATLADIDARGDAAVRELSQKFDRYAPESFRLSETEIEAAMAPRAGPRPGRHPLRPGADPRLCRGAARLHDGHRGRDPAGRDPRPQEHTGTIRRLLRAGRQVPDGRLGAHVGADRLGRRRAAHRRLGAAGRRRAAPGDRRRHASGRRARDLLPRRHPGGRRDGAGDRDDRARRHAGRPRQRLRRRGQAPALRPRRHRPAWPGRPRPC